MCRQMLMRKGRHSYRSWWRQEATATLAYFWCLLVHVCFALGFWFVRFSTMGNVRPWKLLLRMTQCWWGVGLGGHPTHLGRIRRQKFACT